ncbi:MAG: 2-methylcitrate dehydratase [Turneriella sp.]|nr:2-methylcitrate dehydratase [Turneriella sp.]
MRIWELKVYPEKERLPKEKQLAYLMAELAHHNQHADKDAVEMVGNRIIDNAAVAIASLNRAPVVAARAQALAHLRKGGATLYGVSPETTVDAEWATWANNTAVRELDFHDTFLAEEYSHPGDNIPALIAVAEQKKIGGRALTQAILTAYEIHVNLAKAISLHKHKIDHVTHLAPAVAAGIGTLLHLPIDTIYQAINQAVHVSTATRQSRKGAISSWKAYAPGHAAKLAVEAVDRAMRGEASPSPIYEGEDGVIAWMLDGPTAVYHVPLPEVGSPFRSILETYTKEHSAEYQAQAWIDLAFEIRDKIKNANNIQKIILHTSHHTHNVIGTGSNDPQKFDPDASRETLDHSVMYIFAVALEDGTWHHVHSYSPERAHRPSTVALWRKITTVEDAQWTERYHDKDPSKKCFGGRVEILMNDGTKFEAEKLRADAHPAGKRPFQREQYKHKFLTLTEGIVSPKDAAHFFNSVDTLYTLEASQIAQLLPRVIPQNVDGIMPNGFLPHTPTHVPSS